MTAAPDMRATAGLEDWLRDYLAVSSPRSVLLLGQTAMPQPLQELSRAASSPHIEQRDDVRSIADLAGAGRFDMAILLGQLELMTPRNAQQLLARLRDLHAVRVCVILGGAAQPQWRDNDWRALGFVPAGQVMSGEQRVRLFTYDLATYNPGRSWNTAENWAHPDNFDRYRW